MIELRDESSTGPASRALFAQYMALVRERSGIADFAPDERIFARADAFAADDAAWLVAYLDAEPAGCGGLRTLAPASARSSGCSWRRRPAGVASAGACCARWRHAPWQPATRTCAC